MTDSKPWMIPAADDYHDFLRWLEDHNYCKVTYCAQCYFWGASQTDTAYKYPWARCRKFKIDKHYDDYCSDAVLLKGGK